MSTDLTTEVGLFQEFLVTRTASTNPPSSLDEAVSEFREYQRQLGDLREKLRLAEEQSARGETGLFDAEDAKQWLREVIAQENRTE